MSISPIALKAYQATQAIGGVTETKVAKTLAKPEPAKESFSSLLKNSMKQVNDLQAEKSSMVEAFATGEKQNVHELMITMQKAGLAMNITSAVRNKVLETYKELVKMPF